MSLSVVIVILSYVQSVFLENDMFCKLLVFKSFVNSCTHEQLKRFEIAVFLNALILVVVQEKIECHLRGSLTVSTYRVSSLQCGICGSYRLV